MELLEELYRLGVSNVGEIAASDIPYDTNFAKMCKQNACGRYGTNYGCPPYMGPAEELIEDAKQYGKAYVFQTIGQIEDSYDFDGMMEVGSVHQKICIEINAWCKENLQQKFRTLSSGSCNICEKCAALTQEPCRFPESLLASLDVYCVHVSELARLTGMKYMNGEDTVTYFGMIFVQE